MPNDTAPTTEVATLSKDKLRERTYFAPDKLAEAGPFISQLAGSSPVPIHWGLDLNNPEIAEGFGVLVQPLMERAAGGGEMKLTDIIVCPVPSLNLVVADEQGASYLQQVVIEAFGRKLKQAVNGFKETAGSKLQLPKTLQAFVEAARRGSQLATFKELAPKFVKALKKRGYSQITNDMLYNCFTSASFSQQVFPRIVQDQWLFLIDRMIEAAKTAKLDTELLESWKASRAETHVAELDTLDLTGFDIG